ncbi:MAG TPA: flagellar export protein FliJ [Chloroflexota bacterium]|nr:flagellar export protein FliJ [Chloroflexota bacterium]
MATEFRLQSILDFRTKLADRLRLELSALQMRCQEEEGRLDGLRLAEQAALTQLATPKDAALALHDVVQVVDHLDRLRERIAEQAQVVRQLTAEVDRQRERVLVATQEQKALEKLRERHLAEAAQAARRLERVEASEIAMLQFRRAGAVS